MQLGDPFQGLTSPGTPCVSIQPNSVIARMRTMRKAGNQERPILPFSCIPGFLRWSPAHLAEGLRRFLLHRQRFHDLGEVPRDRSSSSGNRAQLAVGQLTVLALLLELLLNHLQRNCCRDTPSLVLNQGLRTTCRPGQRRKFSRRQNGLGQARMRLRTRQTRRTRPHECRLSRGFAHGTSDTEAEMVSPGLTGQLRMFC